MTEQQNREGQQFGNYRLEHLLGRGGFAEVYLGHHLRLQKQSAIKVLHAHLSETAIEAFQQEAQIIAALDHPNIVRILDFDVQNGIPFLVMDYLPNGTLRERHPRGERVPLPTIVSYVKQVAYALQYAHDRRLIHRDVKPGNMLVGRRNEVILSDFGIAAVAHSTSSMTTQTSAGTIHYMAPEQIRAQARTASDQYALGIVVYEWLSGDHPFNGTFTEISIKHLMTPPPPLSSKVPDLPAEAELVVLTALAKDPGQRFGSVQAFATALEQAARAARTSLPISPFGIPPSSPLQMPDPAVLPSQYSPFPAMVSSPDEPRIVGRRGISRRYVVVGLVGLGLAVVGSITYLVLPLSQGGSQMDNWTLHGNASTSPNDFLGTTDSHPLVLKTNNRPAIWIDKDGKVGIGESSPKGYKLEVTADDQFGIQVQGPNSGVGAGIRLESADGRAWEILATGVQSAQGEGNLNIRDLGRDSDDFTITSSGDVGIGIIKPRAKLHVEGDLFVRGSISKTGGGEFVRQRNPVDPTQHIVYATPIGNEVGTYTRGTGKLVKGEALIELPEHFSLVTSEDGLTVQLTPRGEWLQLYVVHLDIRHIIIREAQNKSGQFDYLVQGVRKGYEYHQVIQGS